MTQSMNSLQQSMPLCLCHYMHFKLLCEMCNIGLTLYMITKFYTLPPERKIRPDCDHCCQVNGNVMHV